jgi:hypothetical protein
VTVWFALRTQATIKVTVFVGSANPPSNQSECAPVGTNLFLAAVTVSLSTPLVEGKIYTHDAIFTYGDGSSTLTQNLATATGTSADPFCCLCALRDDVQRLALEGILSGEQVERRLAVMPAADVVGDSRRDRGVLFRPTPRRTGFAATALRP